jgi:hypothetical protein
VKLEGRILPFRLVAETDRAHELIDQVLIVLPASAVSRCRPVEMALEAPSSLTGLRAWRDCRRFIRDA